MKLVAGRATDQGRTRENNEDSLLVDDDHRLFAVADGMGGHAGGEVASRTAIEALRAAFAAGSAIDAAISRANDAVLARAASDAALTGMGTTMTAVTVNGPSQLLVGHVGDSRAYMLRDGTLRRVTEDHSLVEQLVREGRLTTEQAEAHPQRAIVTRALGVEPEVEVDTYTVDVEDGDRVVVCSDGLNTMIRDSDIERIARTQQNPQHAAEALVAAANEAGGEDNITVVVLDVVQVDGDEPVSDDAAGAAEPPAEAPSTAPEPFERADARPARRRGTRLRTVRGAILVLLPIILILGVATAALGWYARGSYFVGAAGNEVVIYKGVPGGVLGWKPTVDQHTGIEISALMPVDQDRVKTEGTRGSLATAKDYVARLQASAAETSSSTSSTTTTVTTAPRTVTTNPT